MIEEIIDKELRYSITKGILSSLPLWFADSLAVENYANESKGNAFFAYIEGEEARGFISLKILDEHTGEISVMGVFPSFRHQGIGKSLYLEAEEYFRNHGVDRILVKTLAEEANYEPYEETGDSMGQWASSLFASIRKYGEKRTLA